MCFETETVGATGAARQETLMVFPVMFKGNAASNLKERPLKNQ
jgi:hypothetical protein